eukprot:COSAG01_NODE_76011_length_191_cov_17.521739_1_plen_47_part_10
MRMRAGLIEAVADACPTPSSNTINTAMHYLTRINMGYSALTGTVYTI